MTKQRKSLGKWGEERARQFLEKNGYKLITNNWRNRYGEIDIIMLDKDTLVFIEVRTKSNNRYGTSIESINYKKQLQMIKTAEGFLQYKNWYNRTTRFDVVLIDKENSIYKLEHLKNVIQ